MKPNKVKPEDLLSRLCNIFPCDADNLHRLHETCVSLKEKEEFDNSIITTGRESSARGGPDVTKIQKKPFVFLWEAHKEKHEMRVKEEDLKKAHLRFKKALESKDMNALNTALEKNCPGLVCGELPGTTDESGNNLMHMTMEIVSSNQKIDPDFLRDALHQISMTHRLFVGEAEGWLALSKMQNSQGKTPYDLLSENASEKTAADSLKLHNAEVEANAKYEKNIKENNNYHAAYNAERERKMLSRLLGEVVTGSGSKKAPKTSQGRL